MAEAKRLTAPVIFKKLPAKTAKIGKNFFYTPSTVPHMVQ